MTTQTDTLLNALQVQTIADTVAEFNFFGSHGGGNEYAEQERQTFVRWLNDPLQYIFGTFEYCNRVAGVRLHVALSADRTRVRYAHLSLDDSWATFTQEQVDVANARMAAML